MATDFFDRQDIARRNTTRLVFLFVLAVLAIMVSIDLLLAATMGYPARDPETGAIDWALAAERQVLGLAVVDTLIVVGGGSQFKTAQLRGGGRIVAEQLGSRRFNPDTTAASEQQLLHVVEEMAIASGTPAPPVDLLDQEKGMAEPAARSLDLVRAAYALAAHKADVLQYVPWYCGANVKGIGAISAATSRRVPLEACRNGMTTPSPEGCAWTSRVT